MFVVLGLVRKKHGGAVWEDLSGPASKTGGVCALLMGLYYL